MPPLLHLFCGENPDVFSEEFCEKHRRDAENKVIGQAKEAFKEEPIANVIGGFAENACEHEHVKESEKVDERNSQDGGAENSRSGSFRFGDFADEKRGGDKSEDVAESVVQNVVEAASESENGEERQPRDDVRERAEG